MAALLGIRLSYEFVRMSDPRATGLAFIIPAVSVVAALILLVIGYGIWAIELVIISAMIAGLERARRSGVIWSVFGLLYIVFPVLATQFVRSDAAGFATPAFQRFLFVVLVVVAADVGAYLGGSKLRGPKMAPKLSPNKTWSGFFSGLILASIVGMISMAVFDKAVIWGLILAAPISVISVVGDFFESGLKRRLNVKDTGQILPGHGGLLDRLDALMAAMGVFALVLLLDPKLWPV